MLALACSPHRSRRSRRSCPHWPCDSARRRLAVRPPAVVMPLYRCNGAFCTYYTVDDQRFRAVVDTGSPFLMVDGRCGPAPTPYCFTDPVRSVDMEDVSEEGYGGQVVRVEWRRGQVSFGGRSQDRSAGAPGAASAKRSARQLAGGAPERGARQTGPSSRSPPAREPPTARIPADELRGGAPPDQWAKP